MNKAAVAFGSFRIWSRAHIQIPVPFPPSAGDFTILAGDWFKLGHRRLRRVLENGHNLPFPDCLLINGRGWNGNTFTVNQGVQVRHMDSEYQMWGSQHPSTS
ncbi:L-ascorbate oxidase homolog [Medicago truncatula]|uniref:L-ascorbate oxidase homolog n=1 Tax=Medicago truncatula TaxID=3880 RepID=UPI000D2F33EC|nr:L-ascorbate oxidase homolog [Medicago truncatula]